MHLHAAPSPAPPICPLPPLPRAVGRLPINWRTETQLMGMEAPSAQQGPTFLCCADGRNRIICWTSHHTLHFLSFHTCFRSTHLADNRACLGYQSSTHLCSSRPLTAAAPNRPPCCFQARQKAEAVANQEDVPLKQKMREIEKLYNQVGALRLWRHSRACLRWPVLFHARARGGRCAAVQPGWHSIGTACGVDCSPCPHAIPAPPSSLSPCPLQARAGKSSKKGGGSRSEKYKAQKKGPRCAPGWGAGRV